MINVFFDVSVLAFPLSGGIGLFGPLFYDRTSVFVSMPGESPLDRCSFE